MLIGHYAMRAESGPVSQDLWLLQQDEYEIVLVPFVIEKYQPFLLNREFYRLVLDQSAVWCISNKIRGFVRFNGVLQHNVGSSSMNASTPVSQS